VDHDLKRLPLAARRLELRLGFLTGRTPRVGNTCTIGPTARTLSGSGVRRGSDDQSPRPATHVLIPSF